MLRSGDQERILWYNYDLSGFVTTNKYIGKLMQAWQRITGTDRGGAVVVLLTDVTSERQLAMDQLKNFVEAMYPEIETNLSEVRMVR